MSAVDPDWVRALVRRALEDRLGLRPGPAVGSSRLDPEIVHPSEREIVHEIEGEGDLAAPKACVIEPHRLCYHSGYCRKLGF